MAFVHQLNRFGTVGNGLVVLVENRDKLGDKLGSFFKQLRAQFGQLRIINFQSCGVKGAV